MFTSISLKLQNGIFSRQGHFIPRWPTCPKIAIFGPPNVFKEEISIRMAIDLGVPILQPDNLILDAAKKFETDPNFNHPFFQWIHDKVKNNDGEAILKEKILLKLLKLDPSYHDGFILNDCPNSMHEALMMEDYKGGLNAFIHLSLPAEILVEIEASKVKCADCHKVYYKNDIIADEHGIYIEKFMPHDGHCDDCSGTHFIDGSDPAKFEQDLEAYQRNKDELLSFYNNNGVLVDFELKKGYESYDKLKRTL